MQKDIIGLAEVYVMDILKNQLDPEMLFHDVAHTENVWKSVKKISAAMELESGENEILELAALFHDTGYSKVYIGHEEESKQIATTFLTEHGYEVEKIKEISQLILATKIGAKPDTIAEQIICDADMNHLASKQYKQMMSALKSERAALCQENITAEAWTSENIEFLKKHQYFTKAATDLFEKGKQKNLQKMTKESNKAKSNTALATSKSAQMAFKTALRNHIDLTALADNKANIMLSVNAILITISIPYLPGYISENPLLLIPASILIITSIASVVTATLATRPIAMNGLSKADKIKTGAANLFFFGNFYKMKKEDYVAAITDVIQDETVLEKSVISDLYHLGASLGDKYKTLRLCYTIFMIGMTLTVIATIAVYIINC